MNLLPLSAEVSPERLFPEITHRKKRVFLTHFTLTGSRAKAAEAAKMDRRLHLYWLAADKVYAAAFDRAQRWAADHFEDEIYRRGVEGWEEPIFFKDQQIATVRKYSDTLLIFGLKGLMPERYKDRAQLEHDLSPTMAALLQHWQQQREAGSERPALEASTGVDAPYIPEMEGEGGQPIPEAEYEEVLPPPPRAGDDR